MRASACLPFSGSMSVERLLEHYSGLVSQEQSLNTRYLTLTETEAVLLSKLAKLHEELPGLKGNFSGLPDISPDLLQSSSLGATHNLIRARVEEFELENNDVEDTQRAELLEVYFLLFLLETKDKMAGMLGKLQSYTGEDYLTPGWKRITRTESFAGTTAVWAEDVQASGKVVANLASLYAEIPSLRLNVTAQDIKTLLASATGEDTTLTLFERLSELSRVRFTEKFSVTISDLCAVFTLLAGKIEEVEDNVDLLPLSDVQQQLYEEMQSEAILTLPKPKQRADRRKMSTLMRGVLEFKLRQAETLTDTNMSSLKADFHSYINKYIDMNQRRDSVESSLGGPLESEESEQTSRVQDRDISKLLKPSVEAETVRVREKQPKKLDFSSRSYERVLLTEVAKTETKIKGVVEKSICHTERLTVKQERMLAKSERLPLLKPNRLLF